MKKLHAGIELSAGILAVATLLASCGGGDGSSPAVTPPSPLNNLIAASTTIGTRNATYAPTNGVTPEWGWATIRTYIPTATTNQYSIGRTNFSLTPASGVAAASWTTQPTPTNYILDTGGWTFPNITANSDGTYTRQGQIYTVSEIALGGTPISVYTGTIAPGAAALPGIFPADAKLWTSAPQTGATTVDQYSLSIPPAGTSDYSKITTIAGAVTSGLTLSVAQTYNTLANPLCENGIALVYFGASPITTGAGRFDYYWLTPNAGLPAGSPIDCTNGTIAAGAVPAGTVDVQQLAVYGTTVLKFINEIPAAAGNNAFSFSMTGGGSQTTIAACLPAPVTQCRMGTVILTGSTGWATDVRYNKVAMDAMMGSLGLPLF